MQGVATVNLVLDGGSDRTYVRSDLINKVGFKFLKSEPVSNAVFGKGLPNKALMRNVFHCILQDSRNVDHSLLATEVDVICTPLFQPATIPEILQSLGDVELAHVYDQSEELKVDILIGLDSYWRFVDPMGGKVLAPGLVAQNTVFGVMLSGALYESNNLSVHVSHQLLCQDVSD